MSATVTITYTRKQALALGLLRCECGHPVNNHFTITKKSCAQCACEEYRELAVGGGLVGETTAEGRLCQKTLDACVEAVMALTPVTDPPGIANAQAAVLNDVLEAYTTIRPHTLDAAYTGERVVDIETQPSQGDRLLTQLTDLSGWLTDDLTISDAAAMLSNEKKTLVDENQRLRTFVKRVQDSAASLSGGDFRDPLVGAFKTPTSQLRGLSIDALELLTRLDSDESS